VFLAFFASSFFIFSLLPSLLGLGSTLTGFSAPFFGLSFPFFLSPSGFYSVDFLRSSFFFEGDSYPLVFVGD
jgi:hypothetical protein